jgi:4-oxalocrotonate tautomerase
MPFVTIKIIEGRNIEQKRGMVKDVTRAIVKNIGCPADAVHIDIVEMKQENLGDGGKLFCDTHK